MAEDKDIRDRAGEMMKKVLTVGVGTLFLTEEALRGLVSEFKLPKELLGSVLESATKTKDEFLGSLSRELMARISDKVEPRELLDEILDKHEINLSVKISFSPKPSKGRDTRPFCEDSSKETTPKPESGSGA